MDRLVGRDIFQKADKLHQTVGNVLQDLHETVSTCLNLLVENPNGPEQHVLLSLPTHLGHHPQAIGKVVLTKNLIQGLSAWKKNAGHWPFKNMVRGLPVTIEVRHGSR